MAKKLYGDINKNRSLPRNYYKKNRNYKKNPPKEKNNNLENTTKINIEKEKTQNLDHSFLEGRVQNKSNRSKKEKEKILMEKESNYKNLVLLKILFFTLSFLCIFLLVVLMIWNHFNENPVEKEESTPVEDRIIDTNYVFVGDTHTVHMDIEEFSMNYPYVVKADDALTTDSVYHDLNHLIYVYNPSVVIMEVGLEDLVNGERVEDIVSRYKIIVNEIQENRPNAHIYVESLYPVNSDKMGDSRYKSVNNATIKKLNQELKVMTTDLKIGYIDVYNSLIDKNQLKKSYTDDGVSLNNDGYKVVWKVLKEVIDKEK